MFLRTLEYLIFRIMRRNVKELSVFSERKNPCLVYFNYPIDIYEIFW